MRQALFLAAVVAVMLCAWGSRAAPPRAPTRTHTVRIDGLKYSPDVLRASPGDTIEFINSDLVPHTVTEAGSAAFDSGMIAPKAAWKLTVREQGTWRYHCLYHPTMTATLIIGPEPTGAAQLGLRPAAELCGIF